MLKQKNKIHFRNPIRIGYEFLYHSKAYVRRQLTLLTTIHFRRRRRRGSMKVWGFQVQLRHTRQARDAKHAMNETQPINLFLVI